ncbi:MAG: hypothetical protein JHC26_06665 [Thermofilum sp.]|jgi:hypothetical protein|uniref:hypothetical protein n=1 Tax=Thermofilum sp. TaxID=1961369 RepID=UPI00258EB572|nr:hypothetical protein [Thermofilum sp.]MCI4408756.1 hypothetical protein [Thermofilum sp.]
MPEKTVHIRIPISLKNELKSKAEQRGVAMWQVILEAITTLKQTKAGVVKRSELDKISWYIYKVSSSFGELRANPNAETKTATLETLKQLHERLGIEVSDVEIVVKQYDGSHSKKKILNDTGKLLVMRIIEKYSTQ